MSNKQLRFRAEVIYQEELEQLYFEDKNSKKPEGWRLSPLRVLTYLMGGTLSSGFEVSQKYFGNKHLMEVAIATLATDRALLLFGLPGTAKSWVSEHLSAAISGDSSLLIQGTAGTTEEIMRYGWNYALLLAKGPSEEALVSSPVMKGMQDGKIVRIEELTRINADVQDALITILSEKIIPIPELNTATEAIHGFNIIATANNKDKGVNELSNALKRRFNTVILPPPSSLEEEVTIVQSRLGTLEALSKHLDADKLSKEINRVVMLFRELRNGVTHDGRTKLKSPSSTLSTAEAISVMQSSITMSTYFGEGNLIAEELAPSILAAVVQEPEQDTRIWNEYLETIVKHRDYWHDLYSAFKDFS
ncbi:MAG: AAA family ATPase [Saprospiraceae bacterium]|nr:AAA family ATPase [Saprospiraceae bacterium]